MPRAPRGPSKRNRFEADPKIPDAPEPPKATEGATSGEAERPTASRRNGQRPTTNAARRREQRELVAAGMAKRSVHMREINDSFIAAAMVMDPKDAQTGGYPTPNAVTRTWQHAAWGYTRSVPELNAAMMFVGNCLSRCKLVPGRRGADGSVEMAFTGEEAADDISKDVADEVSGYIAELQGPRGGQSEMLRSFGEKIFVAGENYVVPEDTQDGGLVFEVLSTQELMREGNGYQRYYGPGWVPEPLPDDSRPIRIWRADGQYQMMATSSVRACLEVLEELVVLTRLVRAAAISRMSLAGMLLLPDELDAPEDEGGPDGNQAESTNPFAVDMINTGAKAIDDPASAAAWMPYVIQGPADVLVHIRHIPFQTDDQENVIKRTEAVERLARGLDLPPEKVLGHANTTFANAAQISDDNFNLYIEPTLQLLCDALTVTYLWPAMLKNRNIDPEHLGPDSEMPEEVTAFAITYDARKLISKPDRTKEVVDVYLHDLTFSAVGIEEVRDVLGLDPNNKPSDEEVAFRINAYRLGRIREVVPAPPADAAVPVADARAGKAAVPGREVTTPATAEQIAQSEADKADKEAIDNAAIAASAALDPLRYLAMRIAGAAELAVDRALEKYGSRLLSKSGNGSVTRDERATLATIDKAGVARMLGPDRCAAILGREEDPMLADIGMFQNKVAGWARQAECRDPDGIALEAATVALGLARQALHGAPAEVTPDLFAEVILGVNLVGAR